MSYLLDTGIISDAARKTNGGLDAWLRAQSAADLHLSVLSLGEIQHAVELLPSGKQQDNLRAWLDHDLPAQFAGRLLLVTPEVSVAWGWLSAKGSAAGRTLTAIDGLLLATAAAHGLTFVCRDARDVEGRGVPVLDPYSGVR